MIMHLISHRGNLEGPIPERENKPEYLDQALSKDFDIELDIWNERGDIFLGHDEPQYKIDLDWINKRIKRSWFHAKNLAALDFLINLKLEKGLEPIFFWHQEDDYTIVSNGYIWAYPGQAGNKNTIAVLPEIYNTPVKDFAGVCSDYVMRYR